MYIRTQRALAVGVSDTKRKQYFDTVENAHYFKFLSFVLGHFYVSLYFRDNIK